MSKYNYHHCVDCGLVIELSSMAFRSKWGYLCYTCHYYLSERENMPNIKLTAEVDGKIVPLNTISTESFEAIKALEKPKEIPVARVGNYIGHPSDKRLFLKLTNNIRVNIADNNISMVAIDLQTGNISNTWHEDDNDDNVDEDELSRLYENVKPL